MKIHFLTEINLNICKTNLSSAPSAWNNLNRFTRKFQFFDKTLFKIHTTSCKFKYIQPAVSLKYIQPAVSLKYIQPAVSLNTYNQL